jgi:hypothetical protein
VDHGVRAVIGYQPGDRLVPCRAQQHRQPGRDTRIASKRGRSAFRPGDPELPIRLDLARGVLAHAASGPGIWTSKVSNCPATSHDHPPSRRAERAAMASLWCRGAALALEHRGRLLPASLASELGAIATCSIHAEQVE